MAHEDDTLLDGEERYLLSCLNRLHRQFEIDSKPYVDKLAAIRARQPPARFYLATEEGFTPADDFAPLGQPRSTTYMDKVVVVGARSK